MKDFIEPVTCGHGLSEFHKVKCVGKVGKGCGSEDKKRGLLRPGDLRQAPRPSRHAGPGYEEHSAGRAFPGLPAVHREAWPRPPGWMQPGRGLPGTARSLAVRSGQVEGLRQGERVRSRTVDSRPKVVGPLSRIRSILPSRSDRTCSARVGESRFERLALGAASGWPTRSIKPRATGGKGTLSATVSLPPVTTSGIRLDRSSTSVSGPGQNCAGEAIRGSWPSGSALPRPDDSFHVNDERIEGRPSFGAVNPINGGGIGRQRAEAVDGFGRERDQTSSGQHVGRVRQGTCGGLLGINLDHSGLHRAVATSQSSFFAPRGRAVFHPGPGSRS